MRETTKELAAFLAGLEYQNIPSTAIEQAKRCLLDFIGVALCGANDPTAIHIFEFFKRLGGTREATIIRHDHKTSILLAALVNGSMAHGLELDDGHIVGHVHPGVTAIPAALAVGEQMGASGKDILTAIVAGYETVIRVGDAVTPSAIYDRGIHAPGLVGAFGASAAVGRLLNLSEKEMTYALGNCCLTPVSPFQTFIEGATIKELYGGWPSLVGALAATMAGDGFTGPVRFFEGPMGFCRNVSENPDLEKITESLGDRWRILEVYFKHHASCSFSHTMVDAALAIIETEPIEPEDIRQIIVKTHRFASDLNEKIPDSIPARKSSLPYCVAVAILRNRVFLDEFTPDPEENEKILNLTQKTEVCLDPELDQLHVSDEGIRPAQVEIYLKNGRVLKERRDVAKGWPENPLGLAELEEKFFNLVGPFLSVDRAEEIRKLIAELETLPDISKLMKRLSAIKAE
jgi:2-methylcitrate dehydratase PrpD